MNWNDEQIEIFDEVKNTSDNLLLEALAGAAKTTTLVELTKYLDGGTLAIAFNKKIADEMQERMPRGVECRTLNSLGHRIWQGKLGKKLFISPGKVHFLMTEELEATPFGEERDHLFENFADLRNAIQGSKNHGHVPDFIAAELGDKCAPLMTDEEFYEMLPEELSPECKAFCQRVIAKSFQMALDAKLDYADQLLMPTVMKCMYPYFGNVLVDEAQDLSELNHRMIERIKKKRLIAVGDSLQAIYAFRGAHRSSMPLLASRFAMKTLHLSTTFRCPEAICNHVRWHAPRIKHWEGNPRNPGSVTRLATWALADVPDGAAVICRNNAPLFRFAIRLLKEGRRPNVWGKDVAANLVKIMEGLGAGNMRRDDAILSLRRYEAGKAAKMKKQSAISALSEKVECILVFLNNAETLNGACVLAKNVFNSEGVIDLCSGHKSKGHEWENVFFLDDFLLDDTDQDLNLRYVIATRSKRNLTYIETEGMI